MKLNKADTIFSRWIRERDKWTCQRCRKDYKDNRQALHCSHYYGRANWTTRFEPDNCVALCYGCHKYFDETNREAYRDFKLKKLGTKKFNALKRLANKNIKDLGWSDKKQLEQSIIDIYT